MCLAASDLLGDTHYMASKRKAKKQRQGASLRMPSVQAETPVKYSWAPKPMKKAKAESAA